MSNIIPTSVLNTTKMHTFTKIYFYIMFFIVRLKYFLLSLFALNNKKKSETILDKISQYIQNEKVKFIAKCKNVTQSNDTEDNYNSNIEDVFYSKKDFEQMITNSENAIEKIWKTRILIEYTPHGNIIMFYNSYKMGFSYYSDVNNISYALLNAVAMKYVIRYRCLNFFVDNEITTDSPLISVHFTEDSLKNQKKDETGETDEQNVKKRDFQKMMSSAPFIKYKKKTQSVSENNKSTVPIVEKKEYMRNKFICLGKTVNFKFLQTIDLRNAGNPLNGFKSGLLDNLMSEVSLNKSTMNYQEYKKYIKNGDCE